MVIEVNGRVEEVPIAALLHQRDVEEVTGVLRDSMDLSFVSSSPSGVASSEHPGVPCIPKREHGVVEPVQDGKLRLPVLRPDHSCNIVAANFSCSASRVEETLRDEDLELL